MRQLLLIVIPKGSLLGEKQRDRLSEFFANMAVAAFSLTLLPIVMGVDVFRLDALLSGLVMGSIFLGVSLFLEKEGDI